MPNEATFSIVIFSSSAAATSFSPACRLPPKKGSEKPAPSPESFIEMSGFEEAAADRARARRSGARAAGANASARGSTAATRIAHRSIAWFLYEIGTAESFSQVSQRPQQLTKPLRNYWELLMKSISYSKYTA
jgi:hypothetical protein